MSLKGVYRKIWNWHLYYILNPTYKGGKRGQKVVRWMIYELNEDVRKWLEKAVMLFAEFLKELGVRGKIRGD
jgi:hypothetical protein